MFRKQFAQDNNNRFMTSSVTIFPAAVSALDTLTTSLQATTIWAKLDAFYIMIGTDRLVNLKNPGTFDLTVTGGTYIEGIGYLLDGVDDFISTNFNPSTAGGNFTQDSASFGYWSQQSTPVATGTPMGVFATNGNTLTGRTSINNNGSYRINQAASQSTTGGAIIDHKGLIACNRSASNSTQFYYNGVSVAGGTDQTSTALINDTFDFGTATGSTFAQCTMGGGFIGGNLTAQEHLDLYNLLSVYFRSNSVSSEFIPDAYSWWADPIAEVQDGYIILGGSVGTGAGQQGVQSFVEINETTGVVSTVRRMQDIYGLDDHHVTVSKRLASGTRLGFFTGHGLKDDGVGLDNTLGITKSLTGRVAEFGTISMITNSMTGVNYGQIHQMGNGRVVITTNTDGTKTWGLVYSDNDGTSWTVAKPQVTMAVADGGGTAQMYEKTVKTGSTGLRMFYHSHTTNVQNNIHTARLDTSDGNYYSGVTNFGSVYQAFGVALADHSNTAIITTLGAGKSHRLMDVNSDGTAFIVCEFTSSDGSSSEYYLYRLTGTDYSTAAHWTKTLIVAAGTPFWLTSRYHRGAVFAREMNTSIYRIYLAREAAGTYYIDRYDSNDGSTWVVTNIKTSAIQLARPVATGSSTIPVVWQVMTSYTDFDTWAMSLAWT